MSRARTRHGAIDALLRAVNINPALPMSWRMLEGVYRLTGDATNADTAAAHVATLRNLPPEVVTATSLFSDGELAPAEHIIRAFLLRHGDHPEAMRLLAKIGMARGVLDDAELLLEAALILAPDHRAARHDYAQALVQRHKYRAGPRPGRTVAGARSGQQGLSARWPRPSRSAWASMNGRSRFIAPCWPTRRKSRTCICGLAMRSRPSTGLPEAIEAYRARRRARPDFGDAYWSLANLKTYRFERCRDGADARGGETRRQQRRRTASISALRWARRWRIAARSRNPGLVMNGAMP